MTARQEVQTVGYEIARTGLRFRRVDDKPCRRGFYRRINRVERERIGIEEEYLRLCVGDIAGIYDGVGQPHFAGIYRIQCGERLGGAEHVAGDADGITVAVGEAHLDTFVEFAGTHLGIICVCDQGGVAGCDGGIREFRACASAAGFDTEYRDRVRPEIDETGMTGLRTGLFFH